MSVDSNVTPSDPVPVGDAGGDEVLVPRRRRRADETEMDITPMIDCVFQLLIFFLVCGRLQEQASVSLPKARHGDAVAGKDSVIVLIRDSGGQHAEVLRGDGQAFSADLATQEKEITEYVEAGLTGAPPFDVARHHVIIKAGRTVKHREVARVSKAAGEGAVDLPQLNIAIMEVQ